MKLDELKALAEKATPGWDDVAAFCLEQGVHNFDVTYLGALSPERVLALIACIEAADAMRIFHYPGDPEITAYGAARAALEQSK